MRPTASQIANPIQFETPISLIIYRQQTNPNNGMSERLCFQVKIQRYRHEIINIHVGTLCLKSPNPDS